jgi:hypothetical protein
MVGQLQSSLVDISTSRWVEGIESFDETDLHLILGQLLQIVPAVKCQVSLQSCNRGEISCELNNQLEISTMVKSGANGNQLRIEGKFKMETDSKDKVRDSSPVKHKR